MCKFYSAIVMKNGDLLHDVHLSSHEDIIDLYNLKDNSTRQNFVRVEYTPDDGKDFADIEKYKLNVDEKNIPEWFEKHREYVTERLKDIVSKRIINTDQKILAGGLYIIGDCKINKVATSAIVYVNSGTVTDNYGTVTDNYGTVTDNYGTVTDNYGTVTDNSGTVTDNSGTVTDNYGTIIKDNTNE
jgi:hypothetical protein